MNYKTSALLVINQILINIYIYMIYIMVGHGRWWGMGRSWKWFSKYIKRLEENQVIGSVSVAFLWGKKKVGQIRRQS